MAKILLVEDDSDIALAVLEWLRNASHKVDHAPTGREGRARLRSDTYDLVLLDWNLPDMSGIDILRFYRSEGGRTPVIFVTSSDSIDQKEIAYGAGGDDFLSKPYSLRELTLKVDALLRRPPTTIEKIVKVGDLELNTERHTITRNGAELDLLPKEFALLEFFLNNPGKVFSADAILLKVWEPNTDSSSSTVVTTITRLRKKIDHGEPSLIQTVFGVGYKLVEPQ